MLFLLLEEPISLMCFSWKRPENRISAKSYSNQLISTSQVEDQLCVVTECNQDIEYYLSELYFIRKDYL